MFAGSASERGDHGRSLLLGVDPRLFRRLNACLGIGDPPSPLLYLYLGVLQRDPQVRGFGARRLQLGAMVLVGGVLRAEPTLEGSDVTLQPRHLAVQSFELRGFVGVGTDVATH